MGRWPYSGRLTVEECMSISTKFLKDHGYLDSRDRSGEIVYSNRGREIGRVGLTASMSEGRERITLWCLYVRQPSGKNSGTRYRVRLVSTRCFFGGRRWWFMCPACHRRVGCRHRPSALPRLWRRGRRSRESWRLRTGRPRRKRPGRPIP